MVRAPRAAASDPVIRIGTLWYYSASFSTDRGMAGSGRDRACGARADAMPGRRATPRPTFDAATVHPAPGHRPPRVGGRRVGPRDGPGLRVDLGAARAGVRAGTGRRVPAQPTNKTVFAADVIYCVLEGTLVIADPQHGEVRVVEAGEQVSCSAATPGTTASTPHRGHAAGAGVLRAAAEQGHCLAVRPAPGDARGGALPRHALVGALAGGPRRAAGHHASGRRLASRRALGVRRARRRPTWPACSPTPSTSPSRPAGCTPGTWRTRARSRTSRCWSSPPVSCGSTSRRQDGDGYATDCLAGRRRRVRAGALHDARPVTQRRARDVPHGVGPPGRSGLGALDQPCGGVPPAGPHRPGPPAPRPPPPPRRAGPGAWSRPGQQLGDQPRRPGARRTEPAAEHDDVRVQQVHHLRQRVGHRPRRPSRRRRRRRRHRLRRGAADHAAAIELRCRSSSV